jgi:hypothetical protein
MTSVPNVPTPAYAETGLTDIYVWQSISNCVAFLTNMDYLPSFHLYKTAASTVVSGTAALAFPTVSYDPAAMSNGTGVTIPLAGIYHFKATVPFATDATTTFLDLLFEFTAGSNNPNFTSGSTEKFGGRGGLGCSTASVDTTLSAGSACPVDLYPGDTITVLTVNSTGTSISTSYNNNSGDWQGRVVPSFMGKWVRNTH